MPNFMRIQRKKNREIAENIRNTKYGQKSIVEIANRKDTISKGASAALLVGGTAVSVVLASKGVISKGQAALGIAASGFVAGNTRLSTVGSVYDELKKSNSKQSFVNNDEIKRGNKKLQSYSNL